MRSRQRSVLQIPRFGWESRPPWSTPRREIQADARHRNWIQKSYVCWKYKCVARGLNAFKSLLGKLLFSYQMRLYSTQNASTALLLYFQVCKQRFLQVTWAWTAGERFSFTKCWETRVSRGPHACNWWSGYREDEDFIEILKREFYWIILNSWNLNRYHVYSHWSVPVCAKNAL